jgi:hypothetical protein
VREKNGRVKGKGGKMGKGGKRDAKREMEREEGRVQTKKGRRESSNPAAALSPSSSPGGKQEEREGERGTEGKERGRTCAEILEAPSGKGKGGKRDFGKGKGGKREFEKKLGVYWYKSCRKLYQQPISVVSTRFVPTSKEMWRHNFEKRCVMLSRYCPLKTHKFVTKCNRSREIFLFSESAQNTKICNFM